MDLPSILNIQDVPPYGRSVSSTESTPSPRTPSSGKSGGGIGGSPIGRGAYGKPAPMTSAPAGLVGGPVVKVEPLSPPESRASPVNSRRVIGSPADHKLGYYKTPHPTYTGPHPSSESSFQRNYRSRSQHPRKLSLGGVIAQLCPPRRPKPPSEHQCCPSPRKAHAVRNAKRMSEQQQVKLPGVDAFRK